MRALLRAPGGLLRGIGRAVLAILGALRDPEEEVVAAAETPGRAGGGEDLGVVQETVEGATARTSSPNSSAHTNTRSLEVIITEERA